MGPGRECPSTTLGSSASPGFCPVGFCKCHEEDRQRPELSELNATTRQSLGEIEKSETEMSILGKILGLGICSFSLPPKGREVPGYAGRLCQRLFHSLVQAGMAVKPSESFS